jgi:hypothetical protein
MLSGKDTIYDYYAALKLWIPLKSQLPRLVQNGRLSRFTRLNFRQSADAWPISDDMQKGKLTSFDGLSDEAAVRLAK